MGNTTGVRVASAAAIVAALVFGAEGLGDAWGVLAFGPAALRLAGTVVAGVCGAVVLVAALRSRDRRALAFGVAVLAFALAWAVSGPIAAALYWIARAALVAFGVLTVRGLRGPQRALGWIVTIAAALWFIAALLTQTVPPPSTAQAVLVVVYAIPSLLQAIAFLAAAVLVAVPLLRPVGTGVSSLWSSAEVR
ncbi:MULTISPECIES: hypothetical protein [unclassified Curtobacterium]|uniref:hypothetical protein n=1 Tax=unclassified Curtobacterium TaxID=257496 RepID=UPI0039B04B46